MKRRILLQAVPALVCAPGLALGQTAYPNKPIRYIIPVAPGGGSDMVGRTITERWGKILNQSFTVDNQSGGGGVIACQATATSAPDGYTLMQGYVATHGTSPATRKVPYDPIKDFTPIGMIGATPNVLVVNADLPVKNVKELIAYLKKNPTGVSYGSAGPGSLTHLTAELFIQATDSDMTHVPYKGVAPAISDLLAGKTQVMFPGLAAALPQLKGERMRALAVTGRKRHPLLKDIPTMEESGFKGFDAIQWYGVVGPAKMPEAVVKTLSASLAQVLAQPDMKIKLATEAIELVQMAPDFFSVFMQVDIQRWSKLAKQRNIHLDS